MVREAIESISSQNSWRNIEGFFPAGWQPPDAPTLKDLMVRAQRQERQAITRACIPISLGIAAGGGLLWSYTVGSVEMNFLVSFGLIPLICFSVGHYFVREAVTLKWRKEREAVAVQLRDAIFGRGLLISYLERQVHQRRSGDLISALHRPLWGRRSDVSSEELDLLRFPTALLGPENEKAEFGQPMKRQLVLLVTARGLLEMLEPHDQDMQK